MSARKYVDFTNEKYQFPLINPIDYRKPGYNNKGEVRIANYRWQANGDCKGIVHWVHGFGDYVGRFGYLAKAFANQGYDFVGIDQRGYGHSEGRRGVIESEKIALDDLLSFNEKQRAKGVPIFLVGHSLGGALSIMMASTAPEQFKGVSLIAPFIDYHEPD